MKIKNKVPPPLLVKLPHKSSKSLYFMHCLVLVKILLMCFVAVYVSRVIFIHTVWQTFLLSRQLCITGRHGRLY